MNEDGALGPGTLEWHKVSGWFRPKFALVRSQGGRELGTLQLGGGRKNPTSVTVGAETWTLARIGWSRRIAITDARGAEVGVFELRFFRVGTLALADGGEIEAAGPKWFSSVLEFTDRGGSVLASLRPRGFGGARCECELTPSGIESGLGGLLLGLGWYLIIQRRRQAAAAAAS